MGEHTTTDASKIWRETSDASGTAPKGPPMTDREESVIVPVEPTEDMLVAADNVGAAMAGSDLSDFEMTQHIWSAMLAARPHPAVESAEGEAVGGRVRVKETGELGTLCRVIWRVALDGPNGPQHPMVSEILDGEDNEFERLATPVPPALPDSGENPHEMFEHFVAEAISRSPEPLQELGRFLADRLDEDDWKTADRLLLSVATGFLAALSQPEPAGKEALSEAELVEIMRPHLKASQSRPWDVTSSFEVVGEYSAARAILNRLKEAPAPAGEWRPIAEHDGSEGPFDLWREGERLTDYFWRQWGGTSWAWQKEHGYPSRTIVLNQQYPPSHFMPSPAPPALTHTEGDDG